MIHRVFKAKQFDILLHYSWQYDYATPQDLNELTRDFFELSFGSSPLDFVTISRKDIPRFFTHFNQGPYMKDRVPGNYYLVGIHFGNCAFSRKVFHKVKYTAMRSAQDYDFLVRAIPQFRNNLLFHVPLILYVHTRSSLEERSRN